MSKRPIQWQYGVMTVPARADDLLSRTLRSLEAAGFPRPRLFVDGVPQPHTMGSRFGLDVTGRWPTLRTYGNWLLGLWELYLRNPTSGRYVVFQDDLIAVRELRDYLDTWCKYPENGFWNLYNVPESEQLADSRRGWYLSNQQCRGALGMVFDQDTVQLLLASRRLITKSQTSGRLSWKGVDNLVHEVMSNVGRQEYVHNPSLLQHIGEVSVMRNPPRQPSSTFPGEVDIQKLMGAAVV